MPKRYANTPQELEALLLEGVLSAAPVEEEITAAIKPPCSKHPDLINPLLLKPL